MTIIDYHTKYKTEKINYHEAEQLLYDFGRDERFELFIALYDATLKNNPNLAYIIFREAYCSSDNIYKQIENGKIIFNLKNFLNNLETQNFDFYSQMRENKKNTMTIYQTIFEYTEV